MEQSRDYESREYERMHERAEEMLDKAQSALDFAENFIQARGLSEEYRNAKRRGKVD